MRVGLKQQGGSIEASTPHELFPVHGGSFNSVYEVAPDGKRIVVNQREPSSDPLEVVVNWPALLKK